MTVIRYESTCCAICSVYYKPGYEGACQEPGCGGTVSYDAAIDAVRQQLAGAVEALRDIATRPTVERNPDGDDQAAHTMQMIAREALTDFGEQ